MATLHWSYSTVRKYTKPYLRTLGRDPRNTLPYVQISFHWALTANRKNGLTEEQPAVGTDSMSVSTGPSRMFAVLTEVCHLVYSREFVGTVYCTYGQSNTINICDQSAVGYVSPPHCIVLLYSVVFWYSPMFTRDQCTFGGWFNIKMSSYQYRKSHCGDKTVVRSSYLHNGISYTGKMTSSYWIRAQMCNFCCQIN